MTQAISARGGRLGVLVALAAALLVAGCGGGSDEDQVREVVNQLGASDPAVCEKVTDKFLENFGGSVEKCKKQAEADSKKEKVEIKKTTIDGDKATVEAEIGGDAGTAKLVKDGGDWKIDTVAASSSSSSNGGSDTGTSTTASGPGETEARGAVDAFLQASKDEDAKVLCGLMSERLAKEIIGKPNAQYAIADCVKAFEAADSWAPLQKETKGVTTQDVNTSGATATVELSNGETASLKRDGDRYVIDDIK